MKGRVIGLIVGAVILLLAGLCILIMGVLPLVGVSFYKSNASFNNMLTGDNDILDKAKNDVDNDVNTVEGISVIFVIFGLLLIGGGTTCAVFTNKLLKN